jgi:predicted nucleic acid-binding OB-fold protein
MLTPEIVKEAIKTAHKECEEAPNGCVHADALAPAAKEIVEDVIKSIAIAIESDNDLPMMIYNHALHVGYRIHQLETTPIDTTKAN